MVATQSSKMEVAAQDLVPHFIQGCSIYRPINMQFK